MPHEFGRLARRKSLPALKFCIKVVESREPNARLPDKLRAAELIMDRGFGKPKQAVDVNLYLELTNEQLRAEAERIAGEASEIAAELAGLEGSSGSAGSTTCFEQAAESLQE